MAEHSSDTAERRVLFSAMKNEAPFVLEWIAYHKVIGFDEIIVVANDCTDNTDGILTALSKSGEVHFIQQQVPVGQTPQGSAVRLVNSSGLIRDGDWCIFLDADEFINIRVGDGTVASLIDRIAPHEGMMINWRTFGDSGHSRFPGRYVSRDYTRAEALFPPITLAKTFFRKSRRVTGFSAVLHRCTLAPGTVNLTEFLNGAGNSLDSAKGWLSSVRHQHPWDSLA